MTTKTQWWNLNTHPYTQRDIYEAYFLETNYKPSKKYTNLLKTKGKGLSKKKSYGLKIQVVNNKYF